MLKQFKAKMNELNAASEQDKPLLLAALRVWLDAHVETVNTCEYLFKGAN